VFSIRLKTNSEVSCFSVHPIGLSGIRSHYKERWLVLHLFTIQSLMHSRVVFLLSFKLSTVDIRAGMHCVTILFHPLNRSSIIPKLFQWSFGCLYFRGPCNC